MRLRDWLTNRYPDEDLLLFDDLDDAVLGVADGMATRPVVVYDREKCLRIFLAQGMAYDEAVDYFEYNVAGAYVGPATPLFLDAVPLFRVDPGPSIPLVIEGC